MSYPLISEYIEAIKSAEDNFEELSYLRPVLGDDGLPVMTSGNFAVVFKMKDEQTGKNYAVKCFTKEQEGRSEAYREIAKELKNVFSPYLVSFRYLEKELFVDTDQTEEDEFPVLLMDWVEGIPLDKYIRENYDEMIRNEKDQWKYKSRQHTFDKLAYNFNQLATWLKLQPFAHGDLKPDNILVQENGAMVLVDYDGMYVPSMKGQKSRELGSLDFRHPYRTENHFDENIDNFPLATILLSLEAISCNCEYYKYSAPDRLLFSEKDYKNIEKCELINNLLKNENKAIQKATSNFIEELLLIFDFLPYINLDAHNVYGYKKDGKFVVCNEYFNNITNNFLDFTGDTIIYQGESAYFKNVEEEKKFITLLIDRQSNISVKLSEETIFFIPRLFTPIKYRHVDILVKGDIREQLIGENYMNQDFLILKGKRYSQVKYLLSFDSYHLLGKFDTSGALQEYYLVGVDEKVCFYAKEVDSFILMASQFGGFDLICQNEEEIWYFNSNVGLKKYQRSKEIDLKKSYMHKDRYCKLLLTNHPLQSRHPLSVFDAETFEKKNTNWIVALYHHSSSKPRKFGNYEAYYLDHDLKQVVIPNSIFCDYKYGYSQYKVGDNNKKPYVLYNSDGEYHGVSEVGRIYETELPIVQKNNSDNEVRSGLFDFHENRQLIPNNFNSIDYRIIDNHVVSIVLIRSNVMTLSGVFLNERVILPIQDYSVIKFNAWTSRLICVREKEDTNVKKLYKWDGTFITNYKYAVSPFRYYDSWQQECFSNRIFKVYDKDYDREFKNEEEVFRLCVNDKMVNDNYFKSIAWCQTFEDWERNVHDILQCISSNGKCGLFHVGLNKWVVPTDYDSIEFDRSFGIPVIMLDGKILLNNKYEKVFSGENLKIINYSWIYAIKDIASNKYVFYSPIKGEIIEDLKQEDGVISSNYFQFSIADEKYLWLKEFKFETNDSNDIDKSDNDD